MLLNCATEKNYKVLSFFFDGVPKPGSAANEQKAGTTQAQAQKVPGEGVAVAPIVSKHPDYAEGNCNNCHDRASQNFLKAQRETVCFSCHDSGEFQGKYVHGPVAVQDCMFCHLPHESQYESLLTKNGRDVCLECHLEADVAANPAHTISAIAGTTPTSQLPLCTECHYAHAAGNHYFLKNQPTAPGQKE